MSFHYFVNWREKAPFHPQDDFVKIDQKFLNASIEVQSHYFYLFSFDLRFQDSHVPISKNRERRFSEFLDFLDIENIRLENLYRFVRPDVPKNGNSI